MAKTKFTPDELSEYFNGKFKSGIIEEARKLEESIRVHAEGTFPASIIQEARPNESPEVLEYRKKIYKSKTKPVFNKIFNSLSKIRRSTDWAITFEDEEKFPKIPEEESLEDYTGEKYPYFTSLTNWAFQSLLREYLIDPNAAIVVSFYGEESIQENEFPKPVLNIINSRLIIDFKELDYIVFENEAGSYYFHEGRRYKGKSFFVYTTMQILRYDQIDNRGNFSLKFQKDHNRNFLPAYKIGGVLVNTSPEGYLYESRISGSLPSLDEAVREYNDLQAAVVMHIYPERWEYSTINCSRCNGTGKEPKDQSLVCTHCKGSCVEPVSPFAKLLVKPPDLGQQPAAIPPAGYVEKDVDIVKLQDERVKNHIYDALAAINMEFLADAPLSQSGIAKEVDRDETNNFVHSVAEDIVRCLDWSMYAIASMRYSVQYPGEEDIKEMLPTISVPEHFDIFSTKFIEEELKNAKDNKLNPVLVTQMETDYAIKKFSASPDVQKKLICILSLDPLANVSEDEKLSRLSNKGITLLDYVISSNVNSFVERAIEENEKFLNLEPDKQRKIILQYAEEIISKNDERTARSIETMNALSQPDVGLNDNE